MLNPKQLESRRRAGLAAIVDFARASSPYYRELYRAVPARVTDPTVLPPTNKHDSTGRFDDWVTDRSITGAEVRDFIGKPDLIGTLFRDRYTAATTSGSTGTPGIFLLDEYNHKAVRAWSFRALVGWLGVRELARLIARRGRMATIAATGAHFVVATSTTAIMRSRFGKRVRLFAAQTPLPELVAQLNEFQPAILAGYAGLVTLLANEQEAGRLRIDPPLVMPGSEALAIGEEERLAKIFRARVATNYVATECLGMAASCTRGWLHLNSDFAIVEPVDADYRPVAPGVRSHTVLVTNLANRIQPIIRYDLGDSIWQRPDPCECGSSLPAIRVEGRTSDLLRFATTGGGTVAIAPLLLQTAVDRLPGVARFQIAQTAPTVLRVRVQVREGADTDAVWQTVQASVRRLLESQGVGGVTLERATEPPQHVPGRKYRTVIPLPGSTAA